MVNFRGRRSIEIYWASVSSELRFEAVRFGSFFSNRTKQLLSAERTLLLTCSNVVLHIILV